ncbi:MAG: hypothetical protein KDD53_02985 [Bdellovibrionales bacterium]|nr:hypothetical protein [Bdellovibrionales bacterium]
MRRSKKLIGLVCVIFAAVVLYPLYVGLQSKTITLNQFIIQKNEIRARTADFEMWKDFLRSAYSLGLVELFADKSIASVDPKNPDDIFGYVFRSAPSYAVVYPTETYYYYSFNLPEVTIAGNFRFLDADKGLIHIGYFDQKEPHAGVGGAKTFGVEQGVNVSQVGDHLYDVTYQGTTKRFKTSALASKPPVALQTLPEEEFVAHIHDESGIRFFLFFNRETEDFYYVLDEEHGVPEKLVDLGRGYYKGADSSFVYFEDVKFKRKVLSAVSNQNIFWNNYYDGPFDQVPPRLALRDKVLAAYPYAKYRGGIDEHGNFKEIEGTRIAISPYNNYEKIDVTLDYLDRCKESKPGSQMWSCLSYEWKRDFHKTLETKGYGDVHEASHKIFLSQGWPANHWGNKSITWPSEHKRYKSEKWPKNFVEEGTSPS